MKLIITDKSGNEHVIEISEALGEFLPEAFLTTNPSEFSFSQFHDETTDFKFDCTIDGVRFRTED